MINEIYESLRFDIFEACRKLNESMSEFAEEELKKAGLFDKDSDYNGEMGKSVLELIKTFSQQGHSGFSANMAADLFNLLVHYKPLTPLTDDPDEWTDVAEYSPGKPLWQSKRDPECFSRDGGISFYKLSDGSNQQHIKKWYRAKNSGKRGHRFFTEDELRCAYHEGGSGDRK